MLARVSVRPTQLRIRLTWLEMWSTLTISGSPPRPAKRRRTSSHTAVLSMSTSSSSGRSTRTRRMTSATVGNCLSMTHSIFAAPLRCRLRKNGRPDPPRGGSTAVQNVTQELQTDDEVTNGLGLVTIEAVTDAVAADGGREQTG